MEFWEQVVILEKAWKVIDSCKTMEQLSVACAYARLAMRKLTNISDIRHLRRRMKNKAKEIESTY